jgi:hypothetical protein
MLIDKQLLKSNVVALFKKIASIGVWGNGRFPQLNSRSALAAANARVSIFHLLAPMFLIGFIVVLVCFNSHFKAA